MYELRGSFDGANVAWSADDGKKGKGSWTGGQPNSPFSNIDAFKCVASIFYYGHSSCKFPKILRQCNPHGYGDNDDAFKHKQSARMFNWMDETFILSVAFPFFIYLTIVYLNEINTISIALISFKKWYVCLKLKLGISL